MANTFFFYDLETSGLNPRQDRIMQFAGQRTDEALNPIGEPYNVLIKLSDDTLPSPGATLVTGITPQMTQADGYSEAEFAKLLIEEIFTPDTTVVGFNSIRFDDEFIRYLLWRNFYDPYQWSWQDGRSRWDILDVVRMTRALRPDGINWPVDTNGVATNRLELLTKENGIEHSNAHDALADVEALIAVTKLLQEKQPQLFAYLLKIRDKKQVQELVNLEQKQPFVYVSGRYEAEYNKATVAFPLAPAPHRNVLVYDLRYDPVPFFDLSVDELAANIFAPWRERGADNFTPVPIKQLQYNRCPAVAPLGVLNNVDGWKHINLTLETVETHKKALMSRPDFAEKVRSVYESREQFPAANDPEAALYDGFVNNPKDALRCEQIRRADAQALADMQPDFEDTRLAGLLPHYKARNFPTSLSKDEQESWEQWRTQRLQAQLSAFGKELQALSSSSDQSQKFLLEELQLWAENVLPLPE